jgi:hypothetical protein
MGPEAEIFRERWNTDFENNLAKIEKQLETAYEWDELNPLRIEIAQCLLSGLSLAAITSTNLLIELFLKVSLIYNETPPSASFCPIDTERFMEPLDKYSSMPLHDNVIDAWNKGLITAEEKEHIKEWKEKFRNPFSHADIKGILDNKPSMMNLVGSRLASKSIKEACKYFIEVDQLIRTVLSRNKNLHPRNNR